MYFLVQIKINNDGTVDKGTSSFDSMNEALIQFHTAMASAMTKAEVKKFTCVILNDNGLTQKIEVYEPIIEVIEE